MDRLTISIFQSKRSKFKKPRSKSRQRTRSIWNISVIAVPNSNASCIRRTSTTLASLRPLYPLLMPIIWKWRSCLRPQSLNESTLLTRKKSKLLQLHYLRTIAVCLPTRRGQLTALLPQRLSNKWLPLVSAIHLRRCKMPRFTSHLPAVKSLFATRVSKTKIARMKGLDRTADRGQEAINQSNSFWSIKVNGLRYVTQKSNKLAWQQTYQSNINWCQKILNSIYQKAIKVLFEAITSKLADTLNSNSCNDSWKL